MARMTLITMPESGSVYPISFPLIVWAFLIASHPEGAIVVGVLHSEEIEEGKRDSKPSLLRVVTVFSSKYKVIHNM